MTMTHVGQGNLAWPFNALVQPWTMMAPSGAWPADKSAQGSEDMHDLDNPCKDSLLSVIERQIIPRLLEAHPAADRLPELAALSLKQPGPPEIEAFARLCLSSDPAVCHAWIQDLQNQGYTTESLFLHLIAPAARFLGKEWELDRLDFSQVTIGLVRMQHLTHDLGYAFRGGPQHVGARRRIMLASAPGSQHILGLVMVSEFFRKERWEVVVEISVTAQELLHAVANEWFEMIGLSVGIVEQLRTVPDLIADLRRASRNPEVKVLLGGPAFLLQPVQAEELGADAIALDAATGVKMAGHLLPRKA